MTIAWYDPTNHHVSADKNDPLFTPLGQLWPLDVQQDQMAYLPPEQDPSVTHAPPQREWVGLSSVDFNDFNPLFAAEEAARWAEAKLKEKNT